MQLRRPCFPEKHLCKATANDYSDFSEWIYCFVKVKSSKWHPQTCCFVCLILHWYREAENLTSEKLQPAKYLTCLTSCCVYCLQMMTVKSQNQRWKWCDVAMTVPSSQPVLSSFSLLNAAKHNQRGPAAELKHKTHCWSQWFACEKMLRYFGSSRQHFNNYTSTLGRWITCKSNLASPDLKQFISKSLLSWVFLQRPNLILNSVSSTTSMQRLQNLCLRFKE